MIVQQQKIDNNNLAVNTSKEVNAPASDSKPIVKVSSVQPRKTVNVSSSSDKNTSADTTKEVKPVTTDSNKEVKPATTETTKEVKPATTETTKEVKPVITSNNNEKNNTSDTKGVKPAVSNNKEVKPTAPDTTKEVKPVATGTNKEVKPTTSDNKVVSKDTNKEVKPETKDTNKEVKPETKDTGKVVKTETNNKSVNSQSVGNTGKVATTESNGKTPNNGSIESTSQQTIESLNQLTSMGVPSSIVNEIKDANPSNITIHQFNTDEVINGATAPKGYIPISVSGDEVTYQAPTGSITFSIGKDGKVPSDAKSLGNGLYEITFANTAKPVKVPEVKKSSETEKVKTYTIHVEVKDTSGKVISTETVTGNTGKDFKMPAIKLPSGYTEVSETINGQVSKDGVFTAPSDTTKGVNVVITVKEDASAKAGSNIKPDSKQTANKPSSTGKGKHSEPAGHQTATAPNNTQTANKGHEENNGDTKKNQKTTDSKIVVEVLANGQTVMSSKTFEGKPGSKIDLTSPSYSGYTLTGITLNGKTIKTLPTKFDNGVQIIIYHVANKSGTVNVKILNNEGKVVGTQKLTGYLGTDANMSNLKLPSGDRISTIVSDGEVVTNVPYKEGTQNVIVNLEPNTESTVTVSFVNSNGKELRSNYIVEGVNGKILRLNDNLLPVGYKVVKILVNGKPVYSVPTVFPNSNEDIVIIMEPISSSDKSVKGSTNSTSNGKNVISHKIASSSNGSENTSGSVSNVGDTKPSADNGTFETPSTPIQTGAEGQLGMNRENTSTTQMIPRGISNATLIHTGTNPGNPFSTEEGVAGLLAAMTMGTVLFLKKRR